jgi:hypothetical protein
MFTRTPVPSFSSATAGTLSAATDNWTKFTKFLLYGYSLFGRAFAYLGIPQAKIFIGEVSLAALWLFKPRALFHPWFGALVHRDPLSGFAWSFLLFMMYGIFEVVYGIKSGNELIGALQILVFNLYPCYIFLGLWAGAREPELLRKYIRVTAWVGAIYGPLYVAFLSKIQITLPGTDVQILGQPGGGSVALLGLLCFEDKPARFWFPITMSAFMLLAIQIRAEWVGFALSMFIWGLLGKKLNRLFLVIGLVISLLAVGFVADFRMPNISSRGGEISTKEIVGRALSGVNPELAREYSANSATYAGTVQWRTRWWKAIRESVAENDVKLLFGLGYGYPLKNLVPYTRKMELRTPHSVLYFALGYSGCIGVVLFFALQACIFQLLWRTYKVTGQAFGLAFWAAVTVSALFGNLFETPAGAIPSYLLIGLCIAPGLVKQTSLAGQLSYGKVFTHINQERIYATRAGRQNKQSSALDPA